MNPHSFTVLEYEKVKNIVASYAFSHAGKIRIEELQPAIDRETVEAALAETRECIRVLKGGDSPPLEGIPWIGAVLQKLKASGGILSPEELLNAAAVLAAGRRIKRFFERLEKKGPAASLLYSRAAAISPLKHIEDAVLSAIDQNAEVKDSASPALRRIRKQISRTREDVLSRMSRILQNSGFQKVVQDPVITVRDDRYVLPLKPNFRQSLKGVVHGQSGSRATLFVEPLEVLDQNNRLAELRMEEREEIERILRDLTALVSAETATVAATVDTLAGIDAVCARARFGIEYQGTVPDIVQDKGLFLKNARHPLLVGKYREKSQAPVIPNDIALGEGQRILILSGPNAGGKTVVLKMTGLLCLMAQSGLPITAAEGSMLPCFRFLFADIGDEQSLEHDLSTFSSHVSRIAEIIGHADADSLVLLDEPGSGTEPGEGAALGAAVLESLIERKCITIVTTHQNALKLFGSETGGAVNAAMEFDPRTLSPTYRLIPGMPGRSFGLDMAARLGVPRSIVEKARERLGQDGIRLEKLLEQVEEQSRLIASHRQALEQQLSAAEQAREEAKDARKTAFDEAREVKAKARSEAREVLSALRRKLREFPGTARLEPSEAKREQTEIEALARALDTRADEPMPGPVPDVHPGDIVRIPRLNKTGKVLAADRKKLELEVNGKKIKVAASEALPEKSALAGSGTATPGWTAEIREEESADQLNIIGKRVPEGLAEVDRFIDRAGLHHLTIVTVIHGLGTGTLKAAVTDFLKNHPLVASFRTGEAAEGGAGVTVVELKK